MSYLLSLQHVGLSWVARTVFALTILSSCSFGQTPCEPCQSARAPAKRLYTAAAPSVDWTTMPSTYTHDETGQRVDQFAQEIEPEAPSQANLVRSGYTHTRSSLQVGFNSDHYHVTEQWGGDVRPYGEWRYPYRPFAVPYGAWGPQLPQVAVNGVGVNPWGVWPNQPGPGQPWPSHPGHGHPSYGHPGHGHPGGAAPAAGGGAGAPAAGAPAGASGGPAGAMGPMGPMGGMGMGAPGPGVPPGHPGMPHGYGHPQGVPWWGHPGVSPYAPYGGVGPYGVGPANGMSPIQEEYYPQAPVYQQPSDGFFHSPYRPVP